MPEVKLFLIVLSLIYLIKNITVFSIKLFETNPEPMKLNKIEVILLYLSFSYVITNLILII